MARILVQRGSSSNASRSTSSSSGSSSSSGTEPPQASSNAQVPPATIDEETSTDEKQEEVIVVEPAECSEAKDVSLPPSDELVDREDDEGLIASENVVVESEGVDCDSPDSPPLPVPPPKPSSNDNRRSVLRSFGALRIGAAQTGSHPSSPRSLSENEGYNSSDEHMPCFVPSHTGSSSGLVSFIFREFFFCTLMDFFFIYLIPIVQEREDEFETEIRQSKGFEIRRMLEDGNCLFRAVADQVYGDSESHDMTRQLCMDYMVIFYHLSS